MPDSRLRRWFINPLRDQLRQGVTPAKLALTLALGLTLGIFPLLGITTVLCALLAVWLRLNQPVIQLVNYAAYPVQLLLLIPFYRAGERLFGADPVPIFSVADLVARFNAGPWQFVLDYGLVGLYGVVVWLLLAPLLGLLIYALSLPLLRRLDRGLLRVRKPLLPG
ncbi:MAG: DUF2062 domain-containing protein [Gammaproteobacteria bacterium]